MLFCVYCILSVGHIVTSTGNFIHSRKSKSFKMKVALVLMGLFAFTLAVSAQDAAGSDSAGSHRYKGSINIDAYGDTSAKQQLDALLSRVEEALKKLGVEKSFSSNHKSGGTFQSQLNFSGERKAKLKNKNTSGSQES